MRHSLTGRAAGLVLAIVRPEATMQTVEFHTRRSRAPRLFALTGALLALVAALFLLTLGQPPVWLGGALVGGVAALLCWPRGARLRGRWLATGTSPVPTRSSSTRALGFWSAAVATALAIAYDVGQIAEWLGWLGSAGGPESSSTPLGLVVLLTPSLLLGSAFLVLLVCVHEIAPAGRKVWSLAALAFGVAYAVLISMNYFVQLTLVAPRLARGETRGIEPFLFVPFDSFLYAVDILGYGFMSVATLFASRVFTGGGLRRVARWLLTANGLLLPFLLFQMYLHPLIWVAALWAVTFPGSTWALALLFRRSTAAVARSSRVGESLIGSSPTSDGNSDVPRRTRVRRTATLPIS